MDDVTARKVLARQAQGPGGFFGRKSSNDQVIRGQVYKVS